VPFRMTLPPSTSTVIRWASLSAVRTSASSIFFLSSDGAKRVLIVIRLFTPLTPAMFEEFGDGPRTLAKAVYCYFVISRSAVQVRAPAPNVRTTRRLFAFMSPSRSACWQPIDDVRERQGTGHNIQQALLFRSEVVSDILSPSRQAIF
jgi:hypothetical protein